jgi:hypothetical protein
MSKPYRGHSIDAYYPVMVHLAISCFRGEDILEMYQSETRIACGGHVCQRIHMSITIANFVLIRLQTWPPRAIRVSDWLISTRKIPLKPPSQMNHKLVGSIYGRSSITIAHFIWIRWQTWPRNKNCLWWPCLSTDRDEMSKPYRGHSIDAYYPVMVHLAISCFRGEDILEMNQSETRIACGGHVCQRITDTW